MPDTESAVELTGEVVYLHAFDIAYDMNREAFHALRELMGEAIATSAVEPIPRNPRLAMMQRPKVARFPVREQTGPQGPVPTRWAVKLLPVGAISISVRVPFRVAALADLVSYHQATLDGQLVHDAIHAFAERVRQALAAVCVRPYSRLHEEEGYTVFCLHPPAGGPDAEAWFRTHRRAIAALLTQELDVDRLSEQEVEESTAVRISYYRDDLAVVDWDAALVIDEPRPAEDALDVMELANLQLTELEAYDRILDEAIERGHPDGTGGRRARRHALRELGELRMDLALFSDELSNTTKFFGEWYLARVYQACAGRFHLADWHRVVDEKLKTLDELHQVLKHDRFDRTMITLELIIVLLFVLDLVLLFTGRP